MNKDNSLLSDRELLYLMITNVVGIGILQLPYSVVNAVGQDGWICVMLGAIYPAYVIMISSYIITNRPEENIITIGKKYFGKVFGNIFSFIYMMEFIIVNSILISGFTNILRTYPTSFLPKANIVIFIIVAAIYMAYGDIKNIARMSKLIFFILVVSIFTSIGSIKGENILNLQPVMQTPIIDIIKNTKLTVFQYTGIESLVLIGTFVKNKKSIKKTVFKSLLIVTFIYTWTSFITINHLGSDIVSKSLWPFILVIENIHIPVINNFRFIFVFLWTVVIMKIISNYYYYSMFVVSSIFNVDKKKISMILAPLLIYSTTLYKNEIIRRNMTDIYVNLSIIFNVLYITLIALLIYINKRTKS